MDFESIALTTRPRLQCHLPILQKLWKLKLKLSGVKETVVTKVLWPGVHDNAKLVTGVLNRYVPTYESKKHTTFFQMLFVLEFLQWRHRQNYAQSAGFEPARAEPNGFLVHRLNHSATTASEKWRHSLRTILAPFERDCTWSQFVSHCILYTLQALISHSNATLATINLF